MEYFSGGICQPQHKSCPRKEEAEKLQDELERVTHIANLRNCDSCGQVHNIDIMCPSHEVRMHGDCWYHKAIKQLQDELARHRRILVTEELPESLEDVVIFKDYDSNEWSKGFYVEEHNEWFDVIARIWTDRVTHWQRIFPPGNVSKKRKKYSQCHEANDCFPCRAVMSDCSVASDRDRYKKALEKIGKFRVRACYKIRIDEIIRNAFHPDNPCSHCDG